MGMKTVKTQKNNLKMEGSSPVTGTAISIARRRLKMLTCTVVGISTLCLVGGGGYMAFKKVNV